MFKLLNPNQMTHMAYKERPSKHEHPDLMEKLTKMLKVPVNTKKMENRNFNCHTKTVCTRTSPFTRKMKKKKRKRKTRKTPVKKESSFFGLF